MKFKQPATAGKQQAAARNRSRARAYACAQSELFFLSQSLRKSAVVLARSTASKGYDEQSLTGEDGRPNATFLRLQFCAICRIFTRKPWRLIFDLVEKF